MERGRGVIRPPICYTVQRPRPTILFWPSFAADGRGNATGLNRNTLIGQVATLAKPCSSFGEGMCSASTSVYHPRRSSPKPDRFDSAVSLPLRQTTRPRQSRDARPGADVARPRRCGQCREGRAKDPGQLRRTSTDAVNLRRQNYAFAHINTSLAKSIRHSAIHDQRSPDPRVAVTNTGKAGKF